MACGMGICLPHKNFKQRENVEKAPNSDSIMNNNPASARAWDMIFYMLHKQGQGYMLGTIVNAIAL